MNPLLPHFAAQGQMIPYAECFPGSRDSEGLGGSTGHLLSLTDLQGRGLKGSRCPLKRPPPVIEGSGSFGMCDAVLDSEHSRVACDKALCG